jgi:hypothetical protein
VERAQLQLLRSAVARGDGAELVALVGDSVPLEVLQLVGDGLVVAIAGGTSGARELADGCAEALRMRGWPGDEELADELEARLGRRTPVPAKALPVDLDELSGLLDTGLGEEGGAVDLVTGEVWAAAAIEYADESDDEAPDLDDADRWLFVAPEGSAAGYSDMEDFIATVDDPARADLLAVAIQGKGAFRRFKDAVARWPDDEERWYRFTEERRRGRARRWLAEAGYRAVPVALD